MVSVPTDGTGADLIFTAAGAGCGYDALIVVSVAVLPFEPPPQVAAGEVLGAMLRARDLESRAVVEEFSTKAGHPAIGIRRIRRAAPEENGWRAVNTGQAQALVIFGEAGALGVVTGACRNPGDLDATAARVAGIVARMTVRATTTTGVVG